MKRLLLQNSPPKQPIALALADALQRASLSPMWFKRIINERVRHLIAECGLLTG